MCQADWEPLSASWSQPAWPTGTHVHHQNLTNRPSNFQSAASTWLVYSVRVALLFSSIHPWWGLAIQLLHVGTNNSKANETNGSPTLSTRTIGLMPFLAILENVSGYLLHWKNKNKIKMCTPTIPWAHVAFQSDYASIFYHRKYRSPRNTIPEHNPLFIFWSCNKSLGAYRDFFQRVETSKQFPLIFGNQPSRHNDVLHVTWLQTSLCHKHAEEAQ